LFDDAWRLDRDVFYDPKMRGADWPQVRTKYAPLVERVTDRDELNDVLAQMLAELGTMHSQIAPGDLRAAEDGGQPGFLGATFVRVPTGARIDHIYRTDPELPEDRSPLARPGVDAHEGDVITAVNGTPVTSVDDIAQLLIDRANQQVLLTLGRGDPAAKSPKEIRTVVNTVDAGKNASLRYSDWEEGRRALVQSASNGRIGYLHLRAMGKEDIATFAREFYAQYDRDGLIIDVRRNDGGNIDSWVIEKLLRRAWAYWTPRYGTHRDATNMQQTFRGHLAVLVDENTYSDGETFAAGVKALGLGPLVGMRTAGAGVWLSDDNRLADRGMARAAEMPQFAIGTGEWLVENKGVEPDVTVENLPNATFKGEDKQLDTALQGLLEKLKTDPVKPL
jgi:tricorn protease